MPRVESRSTNRSRESGKPAPKTLITGHNTDVEYDGVVYHIQTEDKGLETPIILSLVYSGGAILASKRAPYDDLIARGFSEAMLTERLDRQHKLICAAIHAGRLDDLKRMSRRAQPQAESARKGSRHAEDAKAPTEEPSTSVQPSEPPPANEEIPDRFAVGELPPDKNLLHVKLMESRELRAAQFVTLRVLVSRGSGSEERPLEKARVVLKTLGSSFRPTSMISTTNKDGIAPFALSLPAFKEGRAAILVTAEVDGQKAELRRIILPAY